MDRRSLLKAGIVIGSGMASMLLTHQAKALPSEIQTKELFNQNFNDVDGNQHSLVEYTSKILVLNFWATWCPPCIKEMPDLNYLYNNYENINVVGLAVDTVKNVKKFSTKVAVDYPILMAGHDGIKLMKDLGNSVGGLPYTLVFNDDGVPIEKYLGQVSLETLENLLI